ncbi:MAG: right-handed parallel beta-helix repeat-containing protein [Planctomycetota bacterium]|nr:right-handed parallel beta-helix repeat-containing protein [Planctomycetota bacterium]
MRKLLLPVLAMTCLGWSLAVAEDQTWVEVDGTVYGARPDELGPIGGGAGYTKVVTKGDYTVKDLDSLLDALSRAKAGQVVFIPGETEIDMTARIYIEQIVVKIPEGVTLAGNRGQDGSQGALLTSDALKTPVMIRTAGPDVRITGLRIKGPNPKRYLDHHGRAFGPGGGGHDYYYKFPTSDGIIVEHPRAEIDNCEISAFAHAAVYLVKGDGNRIHHNFIHHCQYNGLGYGVCHGAASSVIEFNLFDWNRHSIAGTGQPGCGYVARNNVELGTSLSHCFDMHGGRDRKDGTDIAGTSIEISNNTFRASETPVVIRGVPQEKCDVHHNWFLKHRESREAVSGLSEKTKAFDNVYGEKPTAAR